MRRLRRGASRLGCLFLFVAAALLWGGGQEMYTAFRNRKPTVVTMAEYLRSRPKAEWLEIRDAVAFVPGAMHFYNKLGGDSTAARYEIYVPLYAELPDSVGVPSRVLLKTSDSEMLRLYNAAAKATTDSAIAKLSEQLGAMTAKRTVRGLVQFGIDVKSDEVEKLRAAANSEDFIILAEGAKPSAGKGILGFLGGVVAALLAVWQLARRRA